MPSWESVAVLLGGLLLLALAGEAGAAARAEYDVVEPRVADRLQPVTLTGQELGGEIDRRLRNLVYQHYQVVDLDGKWLDHFRQRTARGNASHVYYGVGKVLDAGSLCSAYTGDPQVAARTTYLRDELLRARDADGYLGFWQVEPENRQDHINWILHEQEYLTLAFVRHYRCTGDPLSLAAARVMADYILRTFPTPQHPCYDAGEICTAGLPEGMLELYRVTGDRRYLDFAADVPHGNNRGEIQLASLRTWDQDFSRRPCHVYVMLARCYAQTELYRLTGEESLLQMSQFMRHELLKQGAGGLLVTGSCSEGEHFTYDQNGRGDIGESCVTAYMLRLVDSLLRLEGDLRYGDLIERTMFNALFAANSPDGRWIRYFTPFSGERRYDTRDSFCCCGNYRRAVAELPKKVYYRTADGGLAVNLFTPSQTTFEVRGQTVTLRQETAYPTAGEVTLRLAVAAPVAFPLRFRTPAWCQQVTCQVNDEPAVVLDPRRQTLGGHTLQRTWRDGDVVRLTLPLSWRLVRGGGVQEGRAALLRGPLVYCLGQDQNRTLFERCPDPRELVLDPASLTAPERDDSIRPDGRRVRARAWLTPEMTGEQVTVTLTEFVDPSGREVYFRVPPAAAPPALPLADDELLSWPHEYANVHLVQALYGPPASGDLAACFEVRGEVVADLAANYVNPRGATGRPAEWPDGAGGQWASVNCANGGLLSTAAPGEVWALNSQHKAFGSPRGYAYGLADQRDELGFVSDYAPSEQQEDAWRAHYTRQMFDRVLPLADRPRYLYTHPVADVARYQVFRWTPAAALRGQPVTVCGKLVSNLGNGVALRVIRWLDATRHEVLATLNTADHRLGACGDAEFVLRLSAGQLGEHLDFVLHNAGSHVCDATALQVIAYTNVIATPPQTDVTQQVQARYHRRLVTPLGAYAQLCGAAPAGEPRTLKLKLHHWRDGRVEYRELQPDAPLDLRRGE
ncbi:MAG: glycoside hydrolase family 127 protein [Fimbriimonadaceae bacterium]|nr:glycoside hydrolase family 127 protein [Fimbriimonadaceae bacterium]